MSSDIYAMSTVNSYQCLEEHSASTLRP